jgi:hypothetical protein
MWVISDLKISFVESYWYHRPCGPIQGQSGRYRVHPPFIFSSCSFAFMLEVGASGDCIYVPLGR